MAFNYAGNNLGIQWNRGHTVNILEISSFIFGVVACSFTMGTIVWRVLLLKIDKEIISLRNDLSHKDLQISNLQDVQTLIHRGLEEKFEHFSTRTRLEVAEVSKQVRYIDHFLVKTTVYETRE